MNAHNVNDIINLLSEVGLEQQKYIRLLISSLFIPPYSIELPKLFQSVKLILFTMHRLFVCFKGGMNVWVFSESPQNQEFSLHHYSGIGTPTSIVLLIMWKRMIWKDQSEAVFNMSITLVPAKLKLQISIFSQAAFASCHPLLTAMMMIKENCPPPHSVQVALHTEQLYMKYKG